MTNKPNQPEHTLTRHKVKTFLCALRAGLGGIGREHGGDIWR
jgi:hypothetical protein